MAVEVKEFGIKILNAVPGGLRTSNWDNATFLPASSDALLPPLYTSPGEDGSPSAGNKVIGAPDDPRLEDYAALRERVLEFMRNVPPTHVTGDADKTAKAIIDTVCGNATNAEGETLGWPDLNFLPLGPDAERDIRAKCDSILKVLEEYKDVTRGIVGDEFL